MWEILTLQEQNVRGFWQMWSSIFAWMAVSYMLVILKIVFMFKL